MPVKYEKTKSHQRYKLKDGTVVPGASTIAGIGKDINPLMAWAHRCGVDGIDYLKARDNAADIGTLTHFRIEHHLKGNEADLSEFSQSDQNRAQIAFEQFISFWEREKLTYVAGEVQLVSEVYRYGGTMDIVCRDCDGGLSIIDLKTGKAIYGDTFFPQVAAYRQLWDENQSEKINRIAIVRIGKETNDFEVRWLTDTTPYFAVFKCQLALYYAKKAAK